ncbi:phage tail sheath subtilisin-like domain-containing protein [Clostridium sp.]|uniref:phage tail sheath subtilisin-like domain-containing protein n=1 Tax=Clostridium sp. TaxID=1506 RepID=UPI002843A543|nr:phage tail sheath subtilisin-like domain-containing protein [Clostridium sp.]MDR3595103.1 phage tail sheath subtilisin-like domain-containing protein [Clostridium sp.]
MALGLPSVTVAFNEAGATAIQRGNRGIVALILKDSTNAGLIIMDSTDDIPSTLTTYNIKQLNDAWIGNVTTPTRVIAYVEPTAATDYSAAMTALEAEQWDYLAVPGIDSADATTISTWIKGLRDNSGMKVKAVLPHTVANHEGIIDFETDNIIVNTTTANPDGTTSISNETYAAADYCTRIAGLIAGTPLKQSATYAVLPEVSDVPHMTITDFNTAIAAGKFVLMNDGKKVKVARAVNSLTTLTSTKGRDYQKIKQVDIMDQINDDIDSTINDYYIGKYPNDYNDKCLLITAIHGYCDQLISDKLIDTTYSIDIDMVAQRAYLKAQGTDISKMTDQQIKEANTGDTVLLAGNMSILDAIENFDLNIGI